MNSKSSSPAGGWKAFGAMLLCLTVILLALFYRSFAPNMVIFSNDGPLGVQKSQTLQLPQAFHGIWYLSWIGNSGGYAFRSVTELFRWISGPEGFSKFYQPFSILFLGVCSWTFFRTLGLRGVFCVVCAIGAMLNSNFFSNVCWGLGSRDITLGLVFLALALLNTKRLGKPWLNAALAGLAIGMGVVEGADNGAIFSLYVAAYVIFQSVVEGRSTGCRLVRSLRLGLVGAFALWIAIQALAGQVGFASFAQKGAASEQDTAEARAAKWSFATTWSLPPAETLRVIIPGLYGYRMDAPHGDVGSVYWGRVGEEPRNPTEQRRFNGSAEYAGMLVVLLAAWALAVSFSKSMGVYTPLEKKMIWFWSGAVLISILLAWGRFAPFYQFVYALPYFSSIRNPMKFMHPAHLGFMVLFGYGLLGVSRRYLEKPAGIESWTEKARLWWKKALVFERRWVWGTGVLIAVSALAYLIYGASRDGLQKHIMEVGYENSEIAAKIAQHSVGEVGLFVVFFALTAGALFLVMAGVFTGKRAGVAGVLLGLVLTADLVRANAPWIIYWDIQKKYASNPILDILREKPYESRVSTPTYLLDPKALEAAGRATYLFPSLYRIEWLQHQYPYYNIQYNDAAQDPRPPADKEAYMRALLPHPLRYWELTSTRYIMGMSGYIDALNSQIDQGRNRFRVHSTFDIAPHPNVQPKDLQDFTAYVVPNGPLALFEFKGALPRASLYTHWQVMTNDGQVLKTLVEPNFDLAGNVLVSDEIPASVPVTNPSAGTVEFTSYKTYQVALHAKASVPSVLLLNDHYDPGWSVTVDGQPARMLRCNFIMRGVQLPPGEHNVVFDFKLSLKQVNISLAAIVTGAVLCVLLCFVRQEEPAPAATTERPRK